MPKQETYLRKTVDGLHVEVVKSYDVTFAREAFNMMNEQAMAFLSHSLVADGKVDLAEEPPADEDQLAEALWQGVEEGAREDWNKFSYFVVLTGTAPVYISSDWPSAEAYANRLTESTAG